MKGHNILRGKQDHSFYPSSSSLPSPTAPSSSSSEEKRISAYMQKSAHFSMFLCSSRPPKNPLPPSQPLTPALSRTLARVVVGRRVFPSIFPGFGHTLFRARHSQVPGFFPDLPGRFVVVVAGVGGHVQKRNAKIRGKSWMRSAGRLGGQEEKELPHARFAFPRAGTHFSLQVGELRGRIVVGWVGCW